MFSGLIQKVAGQMQPPPPQGNHSGGGFGSVISGASHAMHNMPANPGGMRGLLSPVVNRGMGNQFQRIARPIQSNQNRGQMYARLLSRPRAF